MDGKPPFLDEGERVLEGQSFDCRLPRAVQGKIDRQTPDTFGEQRSADGVGHLFLPRAEAVQQEDGGDRPACRWELENGRYLFAAAGGKRDCQTSGPGARHSYRSRTHWAAAMQLWLKDP